MNKDVISCPFCNQMTLEVICTTINVRKMRSSRVHSMKGNDVLVSDTCWNCGRTSKDIRNEYKKVGVRFG